MQEPEFYPDPERLIECADLIEQAGLLAEDIVDVIKSSDILADLLADIDTSTDEYTEPYRELAEGLTKLAKEIDESAQIDARGGRRPQKGDVPFKIILSELRELKSFLTQARQYKSDLDTLSEVYADEHEDIEDFLYSLQAHGQKINAQIRKAYDMFSDIFEEAKDR